MIKTNISNRQHYENWILSLRNERTRANYPSRIKACARAYGEPLEVFIDSLVNDPEGVSDKVLDSVCSRDFADKTILSGQEAMRSFTAYLWNLGVYPRKPYIKRPVLRQRNWMDREEGVSDVEIRRIREYIQTQTKDRRVADNALLECLYPWGLRRQEICSLVTGWVGDSSVKILEKGARFPIEIPASPRALDALHALIEVNKTHGPVFPETPIFQAPSLYRVGTRRGTLPGLSTFAFKAWVDTWGEAIGVKLTPHKFRHGAITSARDLGIPIEQACALFRHSHAYMQELYDDRPGTRALSAIDSLYKKLYGEDKNSCGEEGPDHA